MLVVFGLWFSIALFWFFDGASVQLQISCIPMATI
jgi:hypothetical protein